MDGLLDDCGGVNGRLTTLLPLAMQYILLMHTIRGIVFYKQRRKKTNRQTDRQ